MHKDSTIK